MRKGFQFKKFTVHDDRCAMKVGTDGVLLGAWVGLGSAQLALDIGTGCGVIALMMAQRSPALHIDAVEILASDAAQAIDNIAASPWSDRIKVYQQPIQEFKGDYRYDLVVTNPPYFVNSMLPPNRHRAGVRHALSLSHDQLLDAVERLLAPDGRFAIILPSTDYEAFVPQADRRGLSMLRVLAFHTRPGKPPERHLMEFGRGHAPGKEETMFLYAPPSEGRAKDEWTPAYRALVGDFYL